jgi:hypothetical protein
MNQLPDPTYLRNSIAIIEAEIALKQAHFDLLKILGQEQAEFYLAEAEAKRRSNPTATEGPERLQRIAHATAMEWQAHVACLQVELQKMTAQRDTWKELLKQAEPQLIAEPGGRIVGV